MIKGDDDDTMNGNGGTDRVDGGAMDDRAFGDDGADFVDGEGKATSPSAARAQTPCSAMPQTTGCSATRAMGT